MVLPTSTCDTFEADVGAQVEWPDNLWERDVVVIVDDGGRGGDQDAQSDRLYHGGGLAVIHPAPVPALVWYRQVGHHQLGQWAGHGGLLVLEPELTTERRFLPFYRECVRAATLT